MVNDDNPPPAKIEPDPPEPEAKATGTALQVQQSPPSEPPPAAEPGRSPGLILVAVFAAALALASALYFSRERAPKPAKPEAAGAAPAPVTIEIPDSTPAPEPAGPHDAPGPVNPSPDKIFNDTGAAKEIVGAAPETNRSVEGLINELPPAPHAAPGANNALLDAAKNALKNEGGDDPQADEPEPEASLAPYESRALAEERAEARRALAFAALAAKARMGAPYAAELKAFLAEPQAGPLPALVADHAATGVPTAAALAQDFPAHHRAALASGRRALANGPAAGFAASLASLVNLRPAAPLAGDGPAAVLSRVEAAAMSGDLSRAVAEADALGPEAAAALAPWLDAVRVRLAVDAALAERERAMLAALGTGRL